MDFCLSIDYEEDDLLEWDLLDLDLPEDFYYDFRDDFYMLFSSLSFCKLSLLSSPCISS